VNVLLRKPPTAARAARVIASVTVFVTIVAAVLIAVVSNRSALLDMESLTQSLIVA
jgi:hypothetical protein